ncbi:golgi-to-ER traffic-like protein isoform X1 [Wolffia australiana]
MRRGRSERGVLLPPQEMISKLEKTANAGNFYEAQQMYKSIAARYAAAERYGECLDILQSGASVQLKNGQVTCGAELGLLLVENLTKGKFPVNDENLDRIRKIYKDFPRIPVPQNFGENDDVEKLSETIGAAKARVESCSSFLKAALKWSADNGGQKGGSPELHLMLAEYTCSESPELDMAKVSLHLIRGNSPERFASTLVNFMDKCYPGEDDLAIARAVLLYLSRGNLRDANKLMDELRKQLRQRQLDFPRSDLMQFIVYLLQTLERDAVPLFRMLRQKYKSSIDRESSFDGFLDDIGEVFYGIKRRGGGLQGMFGDLFKMMGSGAMG